MYFVVTILVRKTMLAGELSLEISWGHLRPGRLLGRPVQNVEGGKGEGLTAIMGGDEQGKGREGMWEEEKESHMAHSVPASKQWQWQWEGEDGNREKKSRNAETRDRVQTGTDPGRELGTKRLGKLSGGREGDR